MKIEKSLSNIKDMSNRVIAITGATSGIGKETTKYLASKNAKIICLVRNIEKAMELKDELSYANIYIIQYDQSSFKSIENAIDELLEKHSDVDTIALNAGVLQSKARTEDDYPIGIGVNYLGVRHFIEYYSSKTNKKTKFVIQGSIVAGLKLPKNVDLNKDYGIFKQYNISKIYLEAYFYHLYSTNKYPNNEYVLTEPGVSGTNVIRHLNLFMRGLGKPFMKVFFHSPKKAALPLLTGISELGKNGDFIYPKGLFTLGGYPKINTFPKKRERTYLFNEE